MAAAYRCLSDLAQQAAQSALEHAPFSFVLYDGIKTIAAGPIPEHMVPTLNPKPFPPAHQRPAQPVAQHAPDALFLLAQWQKTITSGSVG